MSLLIVGAIASLFVDDDEPEETASEPESTVCRDVQGIYVGNYSGVSSISGYEEGRVGLIVQENCTATVTMDGNKHPNETLEKRTNSTYLFPNGDVIKFSSPSGGTKPGFASWSETGNGYRIRYRLRRIE